MHPVKIEAKWEDGGLRTRCWGSKPSTGGDMWENPKWGYTKVILALGVLGQKDHECQPSWNYMEKLPKKERGRNRK